MTAQKIDVDSAVIKATQLIEGSWPIHDKKGDFYSLWYRFREGTVQKVPADLAAHLCNKLGKKYAVPHKPEDGEVVRSDIIATKREAPDLVRTPEEKEERATRRAAAIKEGRANI